MGQQRYDIDAKADEAADRGRLLLILQSLIAERFQMKAHREMRETQAYVLTAARSGLKINPQKDGGCPASDSVPCGQMRIVPSASSVRMEGDGVPMAELLRVLAVALDGPVLDRTNLAGLYNIRLEFLAGTSAVIIPPDSPGPSLFSALQEQLGLKLDVAKVPVEFLVIDYIERPSAN